MKSKENKQMTCKLDDCSEPRHRSAGFGYCNKHYIRLLRHGDVNFRKAPRHSMSDTPTHNSWLNMNKRCHNPTINRWHIYGGRGITICERWSGVNGFENFFKDMGERPKGKTLDRIDPNGNYEPNNCRWATLKEQRYNQRIPVKERVTA